MKKLIFILLLVMSVKVFPQKQPPVWIAFDSKWRDSVGILVPKGFLQIPSSAIIGGTGGGDAIRDSILANAIGTSALAGFPTYWASSDSLSYFKPFASIPLDSSYINTSDTVIVGSFPFAMTIDSISIVNHGVAASLTYFVGHNDSINTFTPSVTAGQASTNILVPLKSTSIDAPTVTANSYLAVWFSSVTTKPKSSIITVFYHLN